MWSPSPTYLYSETRGHCRMHHLARHDEARHNRCEPLRRFAFEHSSTRRREAMPDVSRGVYKRNTLARGKCPVVVAR